MNCSKELNKFQVTCYAFLYFTSFNSPKKLNYFFYFVNKETGFIKILNIEKSEYKRQYVLTEAHFSDIV